MRWAAPSHEGAAMLYLSTRSVASALFIASAS
jgi:hypothetical protein